MLESTCWLVGRDKVKRRSVHTKLGEVKKMKKKKWMRLQHIYWFITTEKPGPIRKMYAQPSPTKIDCVTGHFPSHSWQSLKSVFFCFRVLVNKKKEISSNYAIDKRTFFFCFFRLPPKNFFLIMNKKNNKVNNIDLKALSPRCLFLTACTQNKTSISGSSKHHNQNDQCKNVPQEVVLKCDRKKLITQFKTSVKYFGIVTCFPNRSRLPAKSWAFPR